MNFLPHRTAHGQLWQGRGGIALVDGVDLLPFCLRNRNGFDCRYRLGAVGLGRVLDLALFILVPALALVHPELFRHCVFHGAVVLPPHLVVRDPPVLRCTSAVAGQFGFGVDRALRAVVFYPTDAAQVPYVHVQALEGRFEAAQQNSGSRAHNPQYPTKKTIFLRNPVAKQLIN